MKTSNILLIITLGAVLIALTAFNLKLKCSYNKGDYKSEFYGMDFSPISGVTHLEVEGANKITVILKQGEEEGVWINKKGKENIDWSHETGVLTIQMTDAAKAAKSNLFHDQITVVLRDLEGLSTKAYFRNLEDGRGAYASPGRIMMQGFTQAKLNLLMDSKTNITLDSLTIDTLHATIGKKRLGIANLELGSGNKIKTASFDIPGKGMLSLDDPAIDKIQYRLSSDANVLLKGKLVQKLND